jgi:hypothetical protein
MVKLMLLVLLAYRNDNNSKYSLQPLIYFMFKKYFFVEIFNNNSKTLSFARVSYLELLTFEKLCIIGTPKIHIT